MFKLSTYNNCEQNSMRKSLLTTVFITLTWCSFAFAEAANNAKNLAEKYTSLSSQLANNPFKRPLVMSSSESSSDLKGEIYGVIDYPFSTVSTALNKPEKLV